MIYAIFRKKVWQRMINWDINLEYLNPYIILLIALFLLVTFHVIWVLRDTTNISISCLEIQPPVTAPHRRET